MRHTIPATPVIDTNIYADGDHLGSLMTLSGMSVGGSSHGVLEKVVILDKAGQSAQVDILLFDASPTIASSDNAALNIADAEMEKCIGYVAIAASDYVSTSANSVASKVIDPGLACKPDADATIYALLKCRGTPTYGAVSDLVLQFTFRLS